MPPEVARQIEDELETIFFVEPENSFRGLPIQPQETRTFALGASAIEHEEYERRRIGGPVSLRYEGDLGTVLIADEDALAKMLPNQLCHDEPLSITIVAVNDHI